MIDYIFYGWLIITFLFSFIGQGIISAIFIKAIWGRYFNKENKDYQIELLEKENERLQLEKNNAESINNELMKTLIDRRFNG